MKHFKPHPTQSRRITDSERWAWAYANGTCEPPLNTAVGSRQDWIDASCDLLNGEPYEFERLCERLDAFEDFCTVPDDGRSFDEWLEANALRAPRFRPLRGSSPTVSTKGFNRISHKGERP